jgi:hypothetical protein
VRPVLPYEDPHQVAVTCASDGTRVQVRHMLGQVSSGRPLWPQKQQQQQQAAAAASAASTHKADMHKSNSGLVRYHHQQQQQQRH